MARTKGLPAGIKPAQPISKMTAPKKTVGTGREQTGLPGMPSHINPKAVPHKDGVAQPKQKDPTK